MVERKGDTILEFDGGRVTLLGVTGVSNVNDLLEDSSGPGLGGGEIQFGTAGDDTLGGDDSDNILEGLAGNDALSGLGGADALGGGDGKDELDGGAGADTLSGGRGSDVLKGGADADLFVFGEKAGADEVTDFEVGVDLIRLDDGISVESMSEKKGSTILKFDGGQVTLLGVTGVPDGDSLLA